MKYYLILIVLIFTGNSIFSQVKKPLPVQKSTNSARDSSNYTKLPFFLIVCTDSTGKIVSARHSKFLICSKDGKTGFIITPMFALENGTPVLNSLFIESSIKCSDEKTTVSFLFDDFNVKIYNAWNKRRCDGIGMYNVSVSDLVKNLSSIRLKNTNTNEKIDYSVPANDQRYFLEIQDAILQKRFKYEKCIDAGY